MMIGATIGTGGWRRTAELAAAAARKHTGLTVRILGDAEWEPFRRRYPTPVFLKLHLFELLDNEDIFYFDADAIHINPWQPQAYAGSTAISAVLDSFIGDYVKWSGVPAAEYFNSGVMILNQRHHTRLLASAQQIAAVRIDSPLYEQDHLNLARIQCAIPLNALEGRFNHLRFYQDRSFDAAHTVIAHWTPHGIDRTLIEEFYRTGKIVTAANAVAEAGQFRAGVGDPPAELSGRGIVICAGASSIFRRPGC